MKYKTLKKEYTYFKEITEHLIQDTREMCPEFDDTVAETDSYYMYEEALKNNFIYNIDY